MRSIFESVISGDKKAATGLSPSVGMTVFICWRWAVVLNLMHDMSLRVEGIPPKSEEPPLECVWEMAGNFLLPPTLSS